MDHVKMKPFIHSLYGKISLVYLLMLLVLGVILVIVAGRSYTRFTQEADQKLNRTLAVNLAKEFGPFLKGEVDYGGIEQTMHYLMVMNPRVEIYMLDGEGNVLAFFAAQEKVKRRKVRMEPIRTFLASGDSGGSVLGDDPRGLDTVKHFSVAPMQYGENQGFLYVILGGEQYDSALSMVRGSAIARISFLVVGIVMAFTALVGLMLFFFLTRRLRAVTEGVRQFETGNLTRRLDDSSRDEIGQLGRAFNQMANAIAVGMAERERADEQRRDLIANVSHDLRSPMASIQGYVETILIKEDSLSAEERRRFLNIILDTTSRLSRLVDELFELSRLDAQQVQPKLEQFSMAELAQDVVVKFKPLSKDLNIELKASLPKNVSIVTGDIGLLERVLSNLIENALRYTPGSGTVHVGLEPTRDAVRVHVSDTGSGIPAEEIPRVCDRFYRVEKSRASASGGSGLGLAIVKKILALHGSEILIESKLNEGTTVSFMLGEN